MQVEFVMMLHDEKIVCQSVCDSSFALPVSTASYGTGCLWYLSEFESLIAIIEIKIE